MTFPKRSRFQEIQTLQTKKTDVGELEKEREEAVQRLQVSLLPTRLGQPTIWSHPQQTSHTKVYHDDRQVLDPDDGVSVVCNCSYCFHGYWHLCRFPLISWSTLESKTPSQPQLGRFLFPLRLCCCMYTIICELKASEAQFYWLQPWFYTYQTQLMPAGNKAKCTKLSALMEKRGLIHIAWPLLGPPSLLFVVSFLRIMFVYLRPSLSLCSLFFGFTQQLCRAQISMFKYAVKQFMLNKPDGMFSSETVFLAKVARSEMFRAPDLCCT